MEYNEVGASLAAVPHHDPSPAQPQEPPMLKSVRHALPQAAKMEQVKPLAVQCPAQIKGQLFRYLTQRSLDAMRE